jgi:hypothetical protein
MFRACFWTIPQAILSLVGQSVMIALQLAEGIPVLGDRLKRVRESFHERRQTQLWKSRIAGAQTTLAVAAPVALALVAAAIIYLAMFFMVSPSLRIIDPGFIFNSGVGFLVLGILLVILLQVGAYLTN